MEAQLAALPPVLPRALRSQELALVSRQPRAREPARQAPLVQVEEQQAARRRWPQGPQQRAQPVSAQREPPVLAEERRQALPPASSARPWPRLPSHLFPPWPLLRRQLRRRPLPEDACELSPQLPR